MVTIATDRRELEARPDAEAERLAAAAAVEYLDVRLRLARALRRLEEGRTYLLSGCSSAVQFAVRLGVPAAEARSLLDLARALEAPAAPSGGEGEPASAVGAGESVEERVRDGKVSVENLALVGRLLAKPGHVRPGEDWLGWAERMRPQELRRTVHARIEEMAQGEPALQPLTIHVAQRTKDTFARARVLASREAGTALTDGQTFSLVVTRFVADRDDLAAGKCGRAPHAGHGAHVGGRYVAAPERRAVRARAGDRCEVAGCPNHVFLQMAHIVPFASGGTAAAENLVLLCPVHHTQFDAGFLRILCWRDGHPVFGTSRGEEVGPASAVQRATDRGKRRAREEPSSAKRAPPGITSESAAPHTVAVPTRAEAAPVPSSSPLVQGEGPAPSRERSESTVPADSNPSDAGAPAAEPSEAGIGDSPVKSPVLRALLAQAAREEEAELEHWRAVEAGERAARSDDDGAVDGDPGMDLFGGDRSRRRRRSGGGGLSAGDMNAAFGPGSSWNVSEPPPPPWRRARMGPGERGGVGTATGSPSGAGSAACGATVARAPPSECRRGEPRRVEPPHGGFRRGAQVAVAPRSVFGGARSSGSCGTRGPPGDGP